MKWWPLVSGSMTLLDADSAFTTAIGGTGRVWREGASREVQYDAVEWRVVTDNEIEAMNPIDIDWTIRMRQNETKSAERRVAEVELALRRRLCRPVPQSIGSTLTSVVFVDGRDGTAPESGVHERTITVRYEPVRDRYAATTIS